MIDVTYLLKNQSGVYVLYAEDICLYVGQSKNIVMRIRKHRTNGLIPFDRVMVKFCEDHELDTLEFVTIRDLQPKHNIQLVGGSLTNLVDLKALGIKK